MGAVMSFTRVGAADLERIVADRELAARFVEQVRTPDTEPTGYLDKSWAGLRYLFEAARTGVDLFFTGRPLDIAAEGYSVWSPEDVSHTAALLRGLPFDQLAAHYDPERMDATLVYPHVWVRDGDDGLRELGFHYAQLVRVFDFADRHGSGFVQSFA
ncbi:MULTISPECIES: DUF1877 family protein [unclassified Nocardia]|uniref:DUF1877 family protein n=1 Tax=unclassified Nocardia TaxID=2637762 RepID=UPI0033B910E7